MNKVYSTLLVLFTSTGDPPLMVVLLGLILPNFAPRRDPNQTLLTRKSTVS